MIKKVNSGAIVGIIAGIAIIVFAITMLSGSNHSLSASDFSKSSQIQFDYSFGADFYTEMFGVTYNVLQQLEDMSSDNATNIARATNSINQSISYIIMAIGIGVFGLSFSKLFVWVPSDTQKATPAPKSNYSPSETQEFQQETEAPVNAFTQKHEFLAEIESIDSMVEIWNIWRKYKLSTTFPEVNELIRKKKDQEQLYGQSEDIEDSKDEIIKMLQA